MENRFVIEGEVQRAPEVRHSPAGIPIARFVLHHRSQQIEAERPREAVCEVEVIASGAALQGAVRRLQVGSAVRVSGFVTRANHRFGTQRLVLHAQGIEAL